MAVGRKRGSKLGVLFVSPEIPPWMKSGGLGDVTAALPPALRAIGVDVRVLVPGYPAVLSALGDRITVADIPMPGGALPAARLLACDDPDRTEEVEPAPLLVIDAPAAYMRPGGAYLDPQGADWTDNPLRFGLLSKVAALIGAGATRYGWRPDIVHCNDWPTGLAPAYAQFMDGPRPGYVLTIHNLAYQGLFPAQTLSALDLPPQAFTVDGVEYYGKISFLKAGLFYADRLVAVSPRYAEEIQTEEAGCGLQGLLRQRAAQLTGILNGIDTTAWNPATDEHIAHHYDADRLDQKQENKRALQRELGLDEELDIPLLGVVSRLTSQKGLDLLAQIMPALLATPVQLALLGSGDSELEESFRALAASAPRRAAVRIAFDEGLAHRIEAGADIFIMPSRFEPCGLNQLYSLRYGTLPVARETGGLADTVVDLNPNTLRAGTANGFTFVDDDSPSLQYAIERALTAWRDKPLWRSLQRRAMTEDYSWRRSAQRYRAVYESIGTMTAL